MAQSQVAHLVGVGRNEPLFARIRAEADEAAKHEPELAAFLLRGSEGAEAGGRDTREGVIGWASLADGRGLYRVHWWLSRWPGARPAS